MKRPDAAVYGIFSLLSAIQGAGALKIASSLQWIEHTPQPYTIDHFYDGKSPAKLISGGVRNLATDKSIDLAANAETQGLIAYNGNKNIRLIYVICEAAYRIVANKASGIETLADLKGKRVGTFGGTSAGYFVHQLAGSAGLKDSDYRVVSGNVCMKAPCGAGTFPQMIKNGQIDAFGVWETAVELGIEALGDNAVVFQNASLYREVYSLYTTTDKLADEATRNDILSFVRGLNKTLDIFTNKPETVYSTVASAVGVDVDVLKKVWEHHKWSGRWGPDLEDFVKEEAGWLASQQGGSRGLANTDLKPFLDTSILDQL